MSRCGGLIRTRDLKAGRDTWGGKGGLWSRWEGLVTWWAGQGKPQGWEGGERGRLVGGARDLVGGA